MKYKWIFFLISAFVIVPGIISLVLYGLKPSIDFAGGSIAEYQLQKETGEGDITKSFADNNLEVVAVQDAGINRVLVKLPPVDREQIAIAKTSLEKLTDQKIEEIRFETVGPTVGRALLTKTIVAVVLAASFILFYIARQFKDPKFGICAILAMFHDSLVLLGAFSLLGHFFGIEVDALFVTAFLTILSFSVHDTVVVYDRIRESQKNYANVPFEQLANKAVTETLVRSLNNSLTIIFMLIALLLLGGETIRWFVMALLIGTVTGTYSSTFTAAPLLVVWHNLEQRRKK